MWNRRVDLTNNLNYHDKNKTPTRFRSKILTLKTHYIRQTYKLLENAFPSVSKNLKNVICFKLLYVHKYLNLQK